MFNAELIHAAVTSDYVKELLSVKSFSVCRKPGFRRGERVDIEQELVAHILRQAHRYDPARAAVNTFVARVVDSGVRMILRARRRLNRRPGARAASLEQTSVADGQRPTSLAEVVGEADRRRLNGGDVRDEQLDSDLLTDLTPALATALAGLTKKQKQIVKALMDQPQPAVVARKLKTSRRQVGNVIATIRQRFEEAGISADLFGPAAGRADSPSTSRSICQLDNPSGNSSNDRPSVSPSEKISKKSRESGHGFRGRHK
jgi:hypothetical protein